jgi:hypothetical protein
MGTLERLGVQHKAQFHPRPPGSFASWLAIARQALKSERNFGWRQPVLDHPLILINAIVLDTLLSMPAVTNSCDVTTR